MRDGRDPKLIVGVFGGGFAMLLIAFAIGTAALSAKVDGVTKQTSAKLDGISLQLATD